MAVTKQNQARQLENLKMETIKSFLRPCAPKYLRYEQYTMWIYEY